MQIKNATYWIEGNVWIHFELHNTYLWSYSIAAYSNATAYETPILASQLTLKRSQVLSMIKWNNWLCQMATDLMLILFFRPFNYSRRLFLKSKSGHLLVNYSRNAKFYHKMNPCTRTLTEFSKVPNWNGHWFSLVFGWWIKQYEEI